MPKERPVLIFSDLHDSPAGIKALKNWIEEFSPTLIISAGDLSSLNTPNQIEVFEKVRQIAKEIPFWAIEGNNERPETVQWLKDQELYLEEKEKLGWRWVGIGGWGERIPSLSKPLDQNTILITHIPPQPLPAGVKNKPKIHFYGHLHRPYAEKLVQGVRLVQIPALLFGEALLFYPRQEEIKLIR